MGMQKHTPLILMKEIINDLIFNSNPKITKKGFKNTFAYLFKNSNTIHQISSFKEGVDNKIDLLFEYNSSYPL